MLRGVRQAKFSLHPPRIRPLRISWRSFALRRASPTVKALLDWTAFRTASFGFLRISDLHFLTVRLRLSRASLTTTLSVCHAALFQHLRDRNFRQDVRFLHLRCDHLLCPASSISHVYVRPLKLLFARQLRSYSCGHSLHALSCPFDCYYSHLPFIFASGKSYAHPLVIRRGVQGSGTRSFTPRADWSLPHLQLVRLASVSIATVQASIPQSGPRLCFGATPLVPCPFAFQPNPDSVRYVAEQT